MRPPTITMMRLAKRNTKFMSCSMNSTVMSRERLEIDLEKFRALVARHAGGRLVEQQHLRPGGERERDLQQALAAVGQFARRAIAVVAEHQRGEDRVRLVDRGRDAP